MGGVSGCPPDPPGTPQPPLASAVLAVPCVGGLAAQPRNGQQSSLAGEKKIISLPYFSLYSVPAQAVSVGI